MLKVLILLLSGICLAGQSRGQNISINIGPASVKLSASQTQQFKVFVWGTTNTAIAWYLSPSLGTVSRTGLYTAPASIPTATNVTVKAVSLVDPTKFATSTISLLADPIPSAPSTPPVTDPAPAPTPAPTPTVSSIFVSPGSVSLQPAGSQQFTATVSVSGGADPGVTWSVAPSVGTISSTGLYTAPATVATAQNVTVTATSIADATKTAAAVIALAASPVFVPVAISFAAPTDGSQVSGNVPVTASVTGSVARVQLFADTTALTAQLTAAPYSTTWNSNTVPDGSHSISAMAVDTQGNTTTKTISVTVKNAVTTSAITLPIEVMGPAGFTSSVQINLPSVPASPRLWLQVHGLKYQTEASLQVNNSAWLPINDSTVTFVDQAGVYGGIGGGFATLKVTLNVPSGALVAGANTIRFRFNGTDGGVSGFRVLGLNIVGPDGTGVLSQSSFVQDDPSSWQPPLSSASDISAGKSLWSTAALTTPNGPILAKCADCHAQDGRDLKYFNYSNYSIRVRSMFHGLTQQQGDQIASYIRSLNAPAPASARPWNPPYQPGPGLDSGPASNWSAGAGLNMVLDRDVDMFQYLAPGGNTSSWAANAKLSAREIPITIQLPDWNNWLPRIHPLDAWGAEFTNSLALPAYQRLRTNLRVGDGGVSYKNNLLDFQFIGDFSTFLTQKILPSSNPVWTADFTNKVYSTTLWAIVKQWELNQEFQLDGLGQVAHGPTAEARAWVFGLPFNVSPLMSHIPAGSPGLHNGSVLTWKYLAFAWYHYQLVLNYSDYRPTSRPIDWGYAFATIKDLTIINGVREASMLLLWKLQALQMSQYDLGPETQGKNGSMGSGWNADLNHPVELVSPAFPVWGYLVPQEYSTSQRTLATQAYVQSWFDKIQTFTPSQLYSGGYASPTEIPVPSFDGTTGGRLLYALSQLRFYGVSSTLVNQVADWAKTVWPLGAWDATKVATCFNITPVMLKCSNFP